MIKRTLNDLTEELQKTIVGWYNIKLFNLKKSYEIYNSPIADKEFLISFLIEGNISINKNLGIIRKDKRFFTFAQNDEGVNSKGDNYRINYFLQNFDNEIMNIISDRVGKL